MLSWRALHADFDCAGFILCFAGLAAAILHLVRVAINQAIIAIVTVTFLHSRVDYFLMGDSNLEHLIAFSLLTSLKLLVLRSVEHVLVAAEPSCW
jgi:hypothetical protein